MNDLRKNMRAGMLLLFLFMLSGCTLTASVTETQVGDAVEKIILATDNEEQDTPTPTPTPTPEPRWTYYRSEVLEPSSDIHNLAFDQQGYLWSTGYGGGEALGSGS